MNGEQLRQRYDKLIDEGKTEDARLLIMNWTYFITHKEEIEKQLEERIRKYGRQQTESINVNVNS